MKVIGIAVSVNNRKTAISLSLLESGAGTEARPVVVDTFTVTEDAAAWADHVASAATAVRGHAASIQPDVVVIRRADQAPRGRNSDGPKLRLMVEGALVAACRDCTPHVLVWTGAECAKQVGTAKEALDSQGAQLSALKFREATAAALAGLQYDTR